MMNAFAQAAATGHPGFGAGLVLAIMIVAFVHAAVTRAQPALAPIPPRWQV